jgi:hypothetical protein
MFPPVTLIEHLVIDGQRDGIVDPPPATAPGFLVSGSDLPSRWTYRLSPVWGSINSRFDAMMWRSS